MLHVTRQGKGYKRSLYDVLNCCSYALMILAYFQSSRGLEVTSKSSVLSVAHHKVQSWSLREKACSVLRVARQRITETYVMF